MEKEQVIGSDKDSDERRDYVRPQVTTLGTLAQITEGVSPSLRGDYPRGGSPPHS